MSGEEYFDTGGSYEPKRIDALVSYEVLRYGTGGDNEYLYTYRILNQDNSSVGLELFSVGIFEDCDAYNPGFEYSPGTDEVAPTAQYIIGNPPQSATFLFMLDTIDVGQQSTLLTFWSHDMPQLGYGTLTGGGISQVGNLPTPIPEPGSILLLGVGAMAAIAGRTNSSKKHK